MGKSRIKVDEILLQKIKSKYLRSRYLIKALQVQAQCLCEKARGPIAPLLSIRTQLNYERYAAFYKIHIAVISTRGQEVP